MDIPQLAADIAKFIAPFLPYLIAGTKAAAEEAGRQFGKAAWDKAVELWGKLKPKVEESQNAKSAVEKAARKPDDPRVVQNLEFELEEIFEQDISFAQSIKAGNYSIVIGGNVENADIRVIHATNYFENTSQSDSEKEKAQKAFHSYLEKLRRHCNALPLAALGGDDADEDITLDKIYIDLDTTQIKEMSEEASEKEKKTGVSGRVTRATPVSVMEVAIGTKQLVLLGDAGAGKSTFVKKLLALQAAVLLGERKEPLAGFAPDLIPVLIVLRDLSPKLAELNLGSLSAEDQKQALSDTVLEKIRENVIAHRAGEMIPMLEGAFESGKILLVMDGLDEVPQELRGRVRQAAGALIHLHNIERILITSRSRSYTGQAVFPNFQSYTIAPFDNKKIRKFAQAWYNEQCRLGHLNSEQAEKRANDLAGASSTADLIEMSSNPMMLTSIAIIHQKDIGLPRERVRLYHLIVDVLIRRWQKYKAGEENITPSQALTLFLKDDNRLRAVLELLAYEAHRANYLAGNKNKKEKTDDADLSRGQALTLLESPEHLGSTELAGEFLDYVDQRSGLLVGKGGELERPTSYSFPHRTIQEYLAGCYLVGKRNRGREVFKRAAEGDFWSLAALMGAEELFYNHPSTRDALLDLAYHLCPDVPPQTEQAERALLWSGQIACVIGNEIIERDADNPSGGKAYLERLIPRTVNLLESKTLTPRERAEAGNTLAKLGDPRAGVTNGFLFCEIPAGEFLMGNTNETDSMSDNDEAPQFTYNKINSNYFISRYPVTNAQFDLFVNDPQGYGNNAWWTKAGLEWRKNRTAPPKQGGAFDLPNHPVVNISWYESQAFTRWLDKKIKDSGFKLQVWKGNIVESLNLGKDKWQIRLPTEAEWEKAARGTDGLRYPWGNEITPDHANYSDTNLNATSAVGAFPLGTNHYGPLDMSGNVWEWCMTQWTEDGYNSYELSENHNVEGDSRRVVRGGAFNNDDFDVRCAFRVGNYPDYFYGYRGFRVVVSPVFH